MSETDATTEAKPKATAKRSRKTPDLTAGIAEAKQLPGQRQYSVGDPRIGTVRVDFVAVGEEK